MGLNTKQVSNNPLELNWTPPVSGSDGLELSAKRQLQSPPSDPLKCPRCESTNTKFCYYNNYNKTQPRHFCRACKRHWTKGGTLRNVPVGGGRKNKRLRRSTAAATTTPTLNPSYMGFSDQKASFSKPIGHDIKGQVSWDFNGSFSSYEPQLSHQIHQDLGFSAAERNPNPVSSPLNGYNEDATITTRMVVGSCSSSQPWQVLPSTSNFLESNYWNWNDIETMVLADLNEPFKDPQFKP